MAISRLKYPTFFNMSASLGGRASGGTISTSGSYTIHTFSAVGGDSFVVNDATLTVDILVVGGGGCGGGIASALGAGSGGGGGGGGGVIYATSVSLTGGRSYSVNVGAGGVGTTYNTGELTGYNFCGGPGGYSMFDRYIAPGGGGGGTYSNNTNTAPYQPLYPTMGASGGGAGQGGNNYYQPGGYALGTYASSPAGTLLGYNGGTGLYRYQGGIANWASGAGGGGAGGAGGNATGTVGGAGGNGYASSISGSSVTYGGGGGGAAVSGAGGVGGSGGGGAGAASSGTVGTPGTNGLGGGGGGNYSAANGSVVPVGGSGVVIVRYLT